MRWVNSHSYISAWFQPSSPNQCWGFVSKGLQNCPHITTLWSATLSLEKATGSTFYTNAQAYRVLWNTVGGHGGQVCNKDLQTVYRPCYGNFRNAQRVQTCNGSCSKQLQLHLPLAYVNENDSVWQIMAEQYTLGSLEEPRSEKCYSSKESSLQNLASEQSRIFFAFFARLLIINIKFR